jgi:hypothetical protein
MRKTHVFYTSAAVWRKKQLEARSDKQISGVSIAIYIEDKKRMGDETAGVVVMATH